MRAIGVHMHMIGVHMHMIGVHMHMIGVHTKFVSDVPKCVHVEGQLYVLLAFLEYYFSPSEARTIMFY